MGESLRDKDQENVCVVLPRLLSRGRYFVPVSISSAPFRKGERRPKPNLT